MPDLYPDYLMPQERQIPTLPDYLNTDEQLPFRYPRDLSGGIPEDHRPESNAMTAYRSALHHKPGIRRSDEYQPFQHLLKGSNE